MTANEALDNHLSSLPYLECAKKSKEIRDTFEISIFTFSFWRRGRTRIPPFYRPEISRILGKDIFIDVTN